MCNRLRPTGCPSIRTLGTVSDRTGIFDERGVDRLTIRELLAISPAERVARLIQVVNTWEEIRARVSAGGGPR